MSEELKKVESLGRLYSFNANANNMCSMDVEFIIHSLDEVSHNNQIISTETCEKYRHTLVNQPILGKYIKESYCGAGDDNFSGHEAGEDYYRGTNEVIPVTNTVAIGVFTDTEIRQIDGINCLVGKGILWKDRYINCCSLLYEWYERGVTVLSSCEYSYSSYMMRPDGVQEILNPTYTGHCILGSENRGNNPIVLPAYDCAVMTSLNSAINIDIKNNKEKQENINSEEDGEQMENIFVKAFNASLGDKRDAIMQALSDTLTATEFNSAWFSMYGIDTDKNTITYESYNEEDGWKTYQIDFSYNEEEDKYSIDLESKKELEIETKLVAKNELESLNSKVTELEEKVTELEGEKVSLNETITSLNEKVATYGTDKVELVEQITSLNAQVEELKPYKEKVIEAEFNEKLEVALNSYKGKFESVNAVESFESEEVQSLIKDTLSEDKQISLNARVELSDMLLDKLASAKVITAPTQIKEVCGKKINNLIPTSNAKANEEKFGF